MNKNHIVRIVTKEGELKHRRILMNDYEKLYELVEMVFDSFGKLPNSKLLLLFLHMQYWKKICPCCNRKSSFTNHTGNSRIC